MKYLFILLIFLISCGKKTPHIPFDVLEEIQSNSIEMFNMNGDIDSYMSRDFEKYAEKLKAGDTALIYIYSDGGEVDSGESIINSMTKFKTICVADKAASAAFEIFQHCTVRVYLDRTLLMVHHHYVTFPSGAIATSSELLIDGLNAYIQEVGLLRRCAARLGMSINELNEKIAKSGGDWYIYGNDIARYNAADYYIKDAQVTKMIKK
jgi:ATP-dependent protease ClpP protease subunit